MKSWHWAQSIVVSWPVTQGTGSELDEEPLVELPRQLGDWYDGLTSLAEKTMRQPWQTSTGNSNSLDSMYVPPSVWPKNLAYETSVVVPPPASREPLEAMT